MTDARDDTWWRDDRGNLEARFGQESLVLRATPIALA